MCSRVKQEPNKLATRIEEMASGSIGQIDPFIVGKDDWTLYVERLTEYLVANGIESEDKKRAVLVTLMGSQAYELLASLVAPQKPSTKKFDEIVTLMTNYLKPKPLIIAERYNFHKRNQKEGETVSQYLAELKRLAERCQFGEFLEQALRDRLVCGLRSEAVQRRLLAEDDLSLKKAHELAYSIETASKQASEMRTPCNEEAKYLKPSPCRRCGKVGHLPDQCYFKDQLCKNCKKKGHIAKVCRKAPASAESMSRTKHKKNTRNKSVNSVEKEPSPSEADASSSDSLFTIYMTENSSVPSIVVTPTVNGIPLKMELDTGASISIISEKTWKDLFHSEKLKASQVVLKTYSGESLKVLGQFAVQVQYDDQRSCLPLLVVSGNGPPLMGRNWLADIKLNWNEIKQSVYKVSTEIDDVIAKYKEVFAPELGTLKGITAKLQVKSS